MRIGICNPDPDVMSHSSAVAQNVTVGITNRVRRSLYASTSLGVPICIHVQRFYLNKEK